MPDFSIAHPEHRDVTLLPGVIPGVIALPEPKVPISVRKAVMADLKFVDDLQKSCPGALGFQFESALIKRIEQGNILIAEVPVNADGGAGVSPADRAQPESRLSHGCAAMAGETPTPPKRVGYCLGVDRYYKRDDLGIIYQMGVLPEYRRSRPSINQPARNSD